MGYIIDRCGHGLAHNKRAFACRRGEKLDHRARVGHESVRSRAVEIGMGRYILRAVCDILRGVPELLIGQRSIKAEHDYIGVFFDKIDTRRFKIAGQALVAEKIDALAGAVSLEEVYSDMGRDYDALFVNGEAHFRELIPARADIVRRIVREEIEVPPALADFFQKSVRAGNDVSVEIECSVHIDDEIFCLFKNVFFCQGFHTLSLKVRFSGHNIYYYIIAHPCFTICLFRLSQDVFRHNIKMCGFCLYKILTFL